VSKNNEKVTKLSKSSDRHLFNESEYHDENVNTDNSSVFCGCTMCGYIRPLISVSNSEMANMQLSFAFRYRQTANCMFISKFGLF